MTCCSMPTRTCRRSKWPRRRIRSTWSLATLSDGERAAISACYYADLSHEEAAEALGLPLGTVKTHILRAKAKLKVRLAPGQDRRGTPPSGTGSKEER